MKNQELNPLELFFQSSSDACNLECSEQEELENRFAEWWKNNQQDKNKYSEEEMLKLLHKFGFDYTYNYKGEKTIYEWIPEWFEEYKRLLTI